MQVLGLISLLVAVSLGVWFFLQTPSAMISPSVERAAGEVDPSVRSAVEAKADMIVVTTPKLGTTITSPLQITGEARGNWFFEGGFPIVLVDWDGKIIAEYYAAAEGDSMTTDFVPFTATLTIANPYRVADPDYMRRGTLVLKKANPSGLPEHDDALEVPVTFMTSVSPDNDVSSYGDAINSARDAVKSIER